ncbi:glycine cleavage system aminomethyltransferase GcvT [Carnobacterium sp. CS13]|uniref:glycine cleavage system aminomethyltransferase GcvT n=1 Tax=Carnobacterium sp. CS13 TaxID=2800128 RepID=UPI0019139617|nr:glycine cleavage system aminomethyltransferase GcvT [Carnobacterium sp. CS13]QQP69773.1 glycine cleavage system aminomethyltransferase GcvT [Carnobacterium sp. CS13]
MSSETTLKQTPMFEYYKKQGVKLIDFGGWAMPIQFTGIIEEHKAVRSHAGLFDASHMGEFLIEGKDAESYLNHLLTNDVTQVALNQAQYHAMCYPDGGTIDDLILSKLAENRYLITTNAGNTEKDFKWMQEHLTGDVKLEDYSDSIGLLALQGPSAESILQKLTDVDLGAIGSFRFVQQATVAGIENVLISRTGYTGEEGFELYVEAVQTENLWRQLVEVGEAEGLKPCGLGSRDTLRLEAALSLYGHELSAEITPLQAGIGFAVKTKKDSDFIGKTVLAAQRESGVKKKIRGFELTGKGIAREGCKVYTESGKEIGVVTSGTRSPSLGKSIGLALLDAAESNFGTSIKVEVRNKLVDALVMKTPSYRR